MRESSAKFKIAKLEAITEGNKDQKRKYIKKERQREIRVKENQEAKERAPRKIQLKTLCGREQLEKSKHGR